MDVEYLETQIDADKNWLAANQQVSVAQPSGDLMAVGSCRRCLHDTQYPIDLEPVAVSRMAQGPTVSLDVTRMFRCRCAMSHAKRPPKVYTGCGAYWFAQVTGDPGHYTLNPAPAQFIPGAIAVDEAKEAQAGLVQQTAEKWLGAITALLALFSVGGAALTVTSVAALNTGWKLVVATAAVLAVAFGAVAIYYGYRAAYGWLTMAPTATDADASALADRTRGIPERVRAFQQSIPAAGISLTLAVVALMVIWFAPPANPPAPLVKVTYGQGAAQITICGTLLNSTSSAVVHIEVQDGPWTTIQAVPQPVTKISTVAACSP
ncbi:MAG: hypothetical protein ACLP8X_36705 [Streptosporangiaceae bacterium]|jgi:hypothetical protein